MSKDSHFTGPPPCQVLQGTDAAKHDHYLLKEVHLPQRLHFGNGSWLCGQQNFPLHFFYGDSVNAIQIQTWVVLIANLLITVLSRSIKRHCAFSQVVTMVRLMLMYYVDFIAFMENPEKTWNDFLAKEMQKAPPEPRLFD